MSKAIDHRLRKLLELRTDSTAMLEALDAVAAVAAQQRIERSEADTVAFLTAAEGLTKRRADLDAQLEHVTAFLAAHELAPQEARALAQGPDDADGGAAFFSALDRLGSVRDKSMALVMGQQQALGLELLDAATAQQSDALDGLFEWAAQRCRDESISPSGDAPLSSSSSADDDGGAPLSSPASSSFRVLQRALATLRAVRPAYLRACQDALAAARRGAFVRRFLRALSTGTGGGGGRASGSGSAGASSGGGGGGGGSASRPIDLLAHDPLRYVGDMLAFVHLGMAEESELIAALMPPPPPQQQQQQQQQHASMAADAEASSAASPAASTSAAAAAAAAAPSSADAGSPMDAREVLSCVCDGLARPLCVRIDQAIAGPQLAPKALLRLTDVLAFYCVTLGGMLPPARAQGGGPPAASGGLLVDGLRATHATAVARFRDALAAQGARIRGAPPAFPSDLGASGLVLDACAQLDDMLKTYAASLMLPGGGGGGGGGAAGADGGAAAAGLDGVPVAALLDSVLEPVLEACRASAEGLRLGDTCVFMVNNAGALQAALQPYSAASGWVQRLASEVGAWEEGLVQQAANDLLAGCGMLAKLSAMRAPAGAAGEGRSGPMATRPGLSPAELRSVVLAFYAELASASLMGLFDCVAQPRARARVRRDTAAVLSAAYVRFYADVHDEANGYAAACDVASLVTKRPSDVDIVLDLK